MARTNYACRTDFGRYLSRRDWLRLAAAGAALSSSSGWMEQLAAATANNPRRRRSCILLWMGGGASSIDTWDLKPGHENGGPFRELQTSVPGIRISEHLPRLARQMRDLAIIRSMSTREADHGRGRFVMKTGYQPQGPVQYPSLGSLLAQELGSDQAALPNFVSIHSRVSAIGAGFLGARYDPLVVSGPANQPNNLAVLDVRPPAHLSAGQLDSRIQLQQDLAQDFVARHHGVSGISHQAAYERAVRLMRTSAATAFNLEEESEQKRDSYGRSLFGQGCLCARRLVERGVPFVEVNFDYNQGWDTHSDNFTSVARNSAILDQGWSSLMEDLRSSGLLDTTLIVWMGEFGRTPRINPQRGRDHNPNAWSTVLAGGGIRGGQVYGRTSVDGTTVESERPTGYADFIATICRALGVDPTKQNISNTGQPIRIADPSARPIQEILA